MDRATLQRLGKAYEEAHALIGQTLHKDLLNCVEESSEVYEEVMADLKDLWDRRTQMKTRARLIQREENARNG